jgi:hypothetical protein
VSVSTTAVGDRGTDSSGAALGAGGLETTSGGTAAAGRPRPEIQALRAAAVLSVVLFHLWPLRLPDGFVGVDVFLSSPAT